MKTGTWYLALGVSAAIASSSARARADQCAFLPDRAMADRAGNALRGSMMVSFCEPCDDVAPGVPEPVGRVEVVRSGAGWSVEVDGRELDLAYTFVRISADSFANLAMLAGCPAQAVSPSLKIEEATRSGVLITASGAAPAAPPQARARPAAAPTPSYEWRPAPPSPAAPSWLAAQGLVFLLGAGASALTLGAVLRHRRRLRHVPRAVALVAPGPEPKPDDVDPKARAQG
ncbi:MAG: hypothetical protein R3B48_29080 [Kofleriaceae bacterium]